MEEAKTTMIALTPQNFHQWLKELKGISEKANVWEFVDPNGQQLQPKSGRFPDITDYQVLVVPQPIISVIEEGGAPLPPQTPVTRPAEDFEELSEAQQRSYQAKISIYQVRDKWVKEVAHGMRLVDNALRASARTYLPPSQMDSSVRDNVKFLAARYQRSDEQISEQIFDQYRSLQHPPSKQKIEKWVADWETLYQEIVDRSLIGLYGNESIFVNEFLKAGKKWAPNFCESWVRILRGSSRAVKFYETAREYRIAVEAHIDDVKESSRGVGMANAATLQGQEQNQPQETTEKGKGKSKFNYQQHFAGKKCVCGLIHLFENCPHLLKSKQPQGWTETKEKREEIRKRICMKSVKSFRAIKRISDTNILDGLTENSVGKGENQTKQESSGAVAELPQYHFANTAYMVKKSWNPLINSVIYDSGCDYPLIHDKTRFRGEIREEKEDRWVDTPDGEMQVVGYGTMVVKGSLHGQMVVFFPNTAYIPSSRVTLISANKLKREGFIWDMHKDTLQVKTTGQDICEINEKHGLPVIEYNPVQPPSSYPSFANAVQLGNQQKATAWTWHLRLGHCRPEVINQLRHKGNIEVIQSKAPKTVECTTCALSKMHRLVQKAPTNKATKPYEVLHFDLTICNRGFDGTTCIAHFTDEFTSYNWIFPLNDHKEKTLVPVFRGLINQCDRAGMATNSVVKIIRTGQETSIGKWLENWVMEQGIKWEWSAKNVPEQNGKSERFGALLTEKARCIGLHAKLPEELYPEFYLAAMHLINRTPTQSNQWDSPLVAIQKFTGQPIKDEISHLRVYGCKAYPLLKGADAPPRSQKMKARAFIGYLVGYDSTNIFRVWNPDKWEISGYRDVIFNEEEFYDSFQKDDLMTEAEKNDLVEFHAYDPSPAVRDLDDVQNAWIQLPFREKMKTQGTQENQGNMGQNGTKTTENRVLIFPTSRVLSILKSAHTL